VSVTPNLLLHRSANSRLRRRSPPGELIRSPGMARKRDQTRYVPNPLHVPRP
jgi:hypothetical protein